MESNKPKQAFNAYIKYSGLAVQMIASLIIGGWLGSELDKWMGNEVPGGTLLGMLLGLTAAVVVLIRGIKEKN